LSRTRGSQNPEQVALALYRAAFRSHSVDEFRAGMRKAVAAEKDALAYLRGRRHRNNKDRARYHRIQAIISLFEFWLRTNVESKQKLLEKSWRDAQRALRLFDAAGERFEYVETFNLPTILAATLGLNYEQDFPARLRRSREAVATARRAAMLAPRLRNKDVAATALTKSALCLDTCGDEVAEPGDRSRLDLEAVRYWKTALRLSRKAALLGLAGPPNGFFRVLDEEESLPFCQEALSLARAEGDTFSIAWLADQMGARTYWKSRREADPRIGIKTAGEALRFAEEAAEKYRMVNFTGPNDGVLWAHSPYAEYFWLLSEFELDPDRRRPLLKKSIKSTPELFRLAKRSKYPEMTFYANHVTAKSAVSLAETEQVKAEKRRLLLKGLGHRKDAIRVGTFIPPNHWNRGLNLRYLADLEVKIADLEDDPAARERLLLQAAKSMEKGLGISTSYLRSLEKSRSHLLKAPLGGYYRGYGDLLTKLARLTKKTKWAGKAALAYASAAEWLENTPVYAGRPECYWKSAEVYSGLQIHPIASQNFILASRAYTIASKKVPHLEQLYGEYALYMRAWSAIERARNHHSLHENHQAAECYREAAHHLGSTKRWSPLSRHYFAMAKIEAAENYSRNGNSLEAIRALREAAIAFRDSRAEANKLLTLLDQPSEREMVEQLAGPLMEEHCLARIMLEEARMAETKGDHLTSSEKYANAAEKFAEINKVAKSEQEQKEASFLFFLARGWELSSYSELNSTVELAQRARGFFAKARLHAVDANGRLLSIGHIDSCDAMISSWKFAETMDSSYYQMAADKLDTATRSYLEAGYKSAAEHSTARKLLLQAFLLVSQGNKENRQTEKVGFYESAAMLLRESADAFERAGQHVAKTHVVELLDRVERDWELSSQLREILHVATGAATKPPLPTIPLSKETAAGLERFEKPEVEAAILVVSGLPSETSLTLEVKVTNISSRPIHLSKIEGVAPYGTELVTVQDNWKVQGQSLETILRPVAPLRTETVTVNLRLKTRHGLVRIRPRIIFTDDKGVQRHHLMRPRIMLTSRIVDYLALAFVDDYTDSQLPLDHSGWRTLMEIVNRLKVPRSHVYGRPRYGRAFGRQLDILIKSSLVELRIFPGERGRGGDIVKVRARYDNDDVKRCIDELSNNPDAPKPAGFLG